MCEGVIFLCEVGTFGQKLVVVSGGVFIQNQLFFMGFDAFGFSLARWYFGSVRWNKW